MSTIDVFHGNVDHPKVTSHTPKLQKKNFLSRLHKKKIILGYAAAITSAILASLTHSVSKPLLIDNTTGLDVMNPIVLAGIVYIIAGLFFTPLKKNDAIKKISRKNIILMSLIGVAEVSAMIVTFFGIKETTAVNAAIFINSEIIFSMIIAITLFRERLSGKEIPPFLFIVLGASIIPIMYDLHANGMALSNLVLGDMFVIIGGFFFATGNMIAKHISDNIDVKRIIQISSLSAGVFGIGLAIVLGMSFEFSIQQIPTMLMIGILDVGFAALFFIIALKIIGSIKTILLFSTATVFGMMFAHILLNEAITIWNVVSISIVFVGLYWLRDKIARSEESEIQN